MSFTKQITSRLIMVRPVHFGYNPETAESNKFQQLRPGESPAQVAVQALAEFDQMVAALRAAGVEVLVIDDTDLPVKTDAVFPNNWISLHQGGMIITYPMMAPTRRQERRQDVLDTLAHLYQVDRVLQLEGWEDKELFLEGTGSLVLDRIHRIAYACWSDRTSPEVLADFLEKTGYKAVTFRAVDAGGNPVYHTNVLMSIAQEYALVCLDAVPDPLEKDLLQQSLAGSGKEIIPITLEQMAHFAGNALQVDTREGRPLLVMSQTARNALRPDQVQRLENYNSILAVAIPTIEVYGGGSARCMMAENFLPRNEG